MSDIEVVAAFTTPVGVPATGLTLTDIDMYLTQVDRATGAAVAIWNTQNPTIEIANMGHYIRIYTGADLLLYNYHGRATYTGAVGLDQDDVTSVNGIAIPPIGTALEKQYIVYLPDGVTPIQGVKVEVHRNLAMTDVIWVGWTNLLGEARDGYGLYPRLDPGTYYFVRLHEDYSFSNPDLETVP